jgi:cobalt-zinc-cadmium efflux system protein
MTHAHSSHCCYHQHGNGDKNLTVAVFINLLLTIAQIVGGIFSGSLALIADALHNFSDAASLLLALVARKISRRKADEMRSYGYRKVETLAAFTNLVILVLVSLWLAFEAVMRLLSPQPIEGWTVVTVAALALVIDAATAFLTWKESKTSYNVPRGVSA